MLHVDINKSHVNIVISHVDIIYLACRGQKYATIITSTPIKKYSSLVFKLQKKNTLNLFCLHYRL